MHVINAIGIGTTKNMSSIAKELSVTVGTLTISMNSLVKRLCDPVPQYTGSPGGSYPLSEKVSKPIITISISMNR